MLSFDEFFVACSGLWQTERTYHFVLQQEVERSFTEFRVQPLDLNEKQQILATTSAMEGAFAGFKLDATALSSDGLGCPGFAIAFETRSEKGEEVSMSLKALFVPDVYVATPVSYQPLPLPIAAQVPSDGELIRGFYLRDEGYSEAGSIAGHFTYQPTRQTLEMTTYYNRSVAVDQMRFISPELRMRTIVTYRRPPAGEEPTIVDLIGFGVERKQALA